MDYLGRFCESKLQSEILQSESEVIGNQIDLTNILDLWAVNEYSGSSATVFVGDIIVQSYFFTDEEIENDISPKEVNSINDHIKLVDYMVRLSNALNKKVTLTPENEPKTTLIAVENNGVIINS